MRQNPDAIDHLLARVTFGLQEEDGASGAGGFQAVPSKFGTVQTREKDLENPTNGIAELRNTFAQVFGFLLVAARR